VRIVAQDVAVLAGAGLGLVGIDDEVGWPAVGLLGHERPFEAGREAGAAASPQVRLLDLVDDGVAATRDQVLGVVPGAALAGAGEAPVMQAVEILEDAVLVAQHRYSPAPPSSTCGPPSGAEPWRPICEPIFGFSPRARASSSASSFFASRSS